MDSRTIADAALGATAAIAMAAGLVFVAQAVAWRCCARCATLTRWTAVLAIAAWIATAIFHLLIARGAFARAPVLAAIALLVAVAWRFDARRGQPLAWARRDRRFARRVARALVRSPYRLIVAAFVCCALPPVAHALIVPPLGWDALTYHTVKAAMWVQHGTLAGMTGPGPWAYYRNMPAGSEVLTAWSMLPTSSDVFAPLLEIVQWLAIGLAAMALARELGVREPFASTAAGFVMAIPAVRLLLGSGYAELCLLFTFLAGLALGVAAGRDRPALLVLAGGALGVSAATKLPMLAITGVVLLILIAPAAFRSTRGHRACAATASVAYAVAVAPWLIFSTIDTGRPLSPVPLRVGSIVLGRAPAEVDWYLDRQPALGAHPELSVLRRLFAAPGQHTEVIGLLAGVPLAGMMIGFGPVLRRRRLAAMLLGAAALCSILLYFSPSFAVIRYLWTENSSRFLLPAVAIAAVLAVGWCRRQSLPARLFAIALAGCTLWNLTAYALVGVSARSTHAVAAVCGALVVVGGVWALISRVGSRGLRACLALSLGIAACVSLQLFRDRLRSDLLQTDFTIHGFALWRSWSPAVALVDEPSVKYRIAVTSGPWQDIDNWFAYPFMGRRLQNEVMYVPVSGDGQIRHFGHAGQNEELSRTASLWAWQLRLQREHVTHVLSFSPHSIELGWMEADANAFERLAGAAGDWGLFRVK